MNCLLEAAAGAYLAIRGKLLPEPVEEEICTAQDRLEACRLNMERSEKQMLEEARELAQRAVAAKNRGDLASARSIVLERRGVVMRLEKLRGGRHLVTQQLDTIKTSELDREIMLTLKQSTNAIKKAGIRSVVKDVEQVMDELDAQMSNVHDVSSLLANPLSTPSDLDIDIDEELSLMEETPLVDYAPLLTSKKAPPATTEPARVNAMDELVPA